MQNGLERVLEIAIAEESVSFLSSLSGLVFLFSALCLLHAFSVSFARSFVFVCRQGSREY